MNKGNAMIVALMIYLIVDVLYIYLIATPLTVPVFTAVQGGRSLQFNFIAAFVTYMVLVIGFILLIVPRVNSIGAIKNVQKRLYQSFVVGGVLGFVVYGTFNGTNLSVFKDYSVQMSMIDTMWGTTALTFTTFIYWSLISM